MLQQLASDTGVQAWVIGSLLFFVGVYALVALRTWRTSPDDLRARARLPLDEAPPAARVPDPDTAPHARP